MTSITIRPDDSGLQPLKKENAGTPVDHPLNPVRAIERIRSISANERPVPEARTTTTYNGPERRKSERRQNQQRVILDTRNHRERRRQPSPDLDSDSEKPKIGIDVYS